MTNDEKLSTLKLMLGKTEDADDVLLYTYLALSKSEILGWLYASYDAIPSTVTDVPTKYESTQVMACVTGFGMIGAEGQVAHNEGGIQRTFKHADMVSYIRAHVTPLARVI